MMFRRSNKQPSLLPRTAPHRSRRRNTRSITGHNNKNNMWMVPLSLLLLILGLHSVLRQPITNNNNNSHHRRIKEDIHSYYDVIIIGTGPAGLTAALYSVRAGWHTLLLGSLNDSQLAQASQLDNVPGSYNNNNNGLQWLEGMREQVWGQSSAAASTNNRSLLHWAHPTVSVKRLSRNRAGRVWDVTLDTETTVSGVAVVVATGASPRTLNLPHEDALWGKQVHSCAVCDGSAYAGRVVLVVGGGDAAVDAALYLGKWASKVIVVHRRTSFRATNRNNVQWMQQASNIDLFVPFTVASYKVQDNKLVGVNLQSSEDPSSKQHVPCDGVFLLLGSTPNTQFLQQSSGDFTDRDGYMETDPVNGLFAAGDIVDKRYHQAVTAASSGAQVILDAKDFLHDTVSANHAVPNHVPLWQPLKSAEPPRKHEPLSDTKQEKGDTRPYDCDLLSLDCVTQIIQRYPVVVFSKPWCPHCKRALEAMDAEGITPLVIDLTMPNARSIQATTLATLSGGRRTVPNVFVSGKSIGGGDETVALHKAGQLRTLLMEAKAL